MSTSQENKPKSKYEIAAEELAKAIKKAGKTQIDIAAAVCMSTKQLQNYLDGKFPAHKMDKVKALDNLLGTNLYEILDEKNIPTQGAEKRGQEYPDITMLYRHYLEIQKRMLEELGEIKANLNRLTLIAAGKRQVSTEEVDYLLAELAKKNNVSMNPFEDLDEKREKEGNSRAGN